eukprot:gene7193-7960_t
MERVPDSFSSLSLCLSAGDGLSVTPAGDGILGKRVPDALIIDNILPYISDWQSLISFSSTSRSFRELVTSSQAAEVWTRCHGKRFHLCIDGYCSTCPFSASRSTFASALRVMERFPMQLLEVHCFLADLPVCLCALAKKSTIASLELSLTNQSSSPPLEKLLQASELSALPLNSFAALRDLSLNSSHLYHVKLPGRARLLDLLGGRLEKLQFLNLSPSGVFSILSLRCPRLRTLRVDKPQTLPDLMAYFNDNLCELHLCRCMFIPEGRLQLNALRKLRFSAAFRMEDCQVKAAVGLAPLSVVDFSLEVPGPLASLAVSHVCKLLPHLQKLTLEGCYEKGVLSTQSLQTLGHRCTRLQSFEIHTSKSVNKLGFESMAAFLSLSQCQSLRVLRVMLDETVVVHLQELLQRDSSLETIVIKAKRRWIPCEAWASLVEHFRQVAAQRPSVSVSLLNLSDDET